MSLSQNLITEGDSSNNIVSSVWLGYVTPYYKIPVSVSEVILKELIDNYSEPGRHYHTLTHISSLLELYHEYEHKFKSKSIVLLAILFHDIIYNPKNNDNEENSAALFSNLLDSYLPKDDINKISRYIICTKFHTLSGKSQENEADESENDKDLKYFLDMDMSILGSPMEVYSDYAHKIRLEYQHIPEADYCTGRAGFLKSVVSERDSNNNSKKNCNIYITEEFFKRFEEQAVKNLLNEIQLLENGRIF